MVGRRGEAFDLFKKICKHIFLFFYHPAALASQLPKVSSCKDCPYNTCHRAATIILYSDKTKTTGQIF